MLLHHLVERVVVFLLHLLLGVFFLKLHIDIRVAASAQVRGAFVIDFAHLTLNKLVKCVLLVIICDWCDCFAHHFSDFVLVLDYAPKIHILIINLFALVKPFWIRLILVILIGGRATLSLLIGLTLLEITCRFTCKISYNYWRFLVVGILQ